MGHIARRSLLAVLLGLVCFVHADAQPTASDILTNVQKTYQDVVALTADFEQILAIALTDEIQESTGALVLQSPDKFYMSYEEPDRQQIVSNGEKVWFHDLEMEQVIIRDASMIDPTLNPMYFLTHVKDDYEAELSGEEEIDGKACYHLILISKHLEQAPTFERMDIWVSQKDWVVRQFQVFNINNDYTTYTLKDIKLNPELEAKQFEFEVPDNVEVIDET